MVAERRIELSAPSQSHLLPLVRGLVQAGWELERVPRNGRMIRNRQLLVLRTNTGESRFRLFGYKVTGSSRNRPEERRIQITTTYQKNLTPLPGYEDVVFGFDRGNGVYVGVDPRRLEHGGPTGNASTFFDREGLNWDREDELLIVPHAAHLFPGEEVEYHAFFMPSCAAEYLLNVDAIHTGSYARRGPDSLVGSEQTEKTVSLNVPVNLAEGEVLILRAPAVARKQARAGDDLVEAYESADHDRFQRAKLTPEQFLDIKKRSEENGLLGEQFVLQYERRRLRKAGRQDLAERVDWISQRSVSEGFDILSYEDNGEERWIEVKATSGTGMVFEMSANEWRTAERAGDKYHLYRVTSVKAKPKIQDLGNPSKLEEEGAISKSPTGWRVRPT